ncbi:hypothetical protein V5799_033278 [Amblyomma americanum]|uniref:Peptidase S1 domain-containing protein n=2 Tax=Amblyomma americanum TaxID=6943 RepID=A0AAQ4DNS4_AMBAM
MGVGSGCALLVARSYCRNQRTTWRIRIICMQSAYILPPNTSAQNDIAIIKLDEDVPLSDFIQPICLPEYSITDTLPADTELYTAGWGRIDRDDEGVLAEVLKQLETKTISAEECQKRISVKLLDTFICTEHISGSTCHGDSGGPVVRRSDDGTWFLEGVISGGPRKCGDTVTPMRSTRVSRFVRWVDEYRRRDANGTLDDFCKPVNAKTSDREPEESEN